MTKLPGCSRMLMRVQFIQPRNKQAPMSKKKLVSSRKTKMRSSIVVQT
jgi:hypothetical protein